MVADFGAGGMMLTTGILAALLQAKTTDRGQVIDAAMTDGVPLLMGTAFTLRANDRWNEDRYNNLVDGSAYFYSTYECADGRWIALGAIEPQFHELLLEKLGLTDAPEFHNPMNSENWGAAKLRLAAVFITQDQTHWRELLENTDACFAPVLTMSEAPQHPHNVARSTFIEIEGTLQAAPAPRFSGTPSGTPTAPPLPGEHNYEVLREWGFDESEVTKLTHSGAIG
jgi:alpha-methylacyl-CoA racemase